MVDIGEDARIRDELKQVRIACLPILRCVEMLVGFLNECWLNVVLRCQPQETSQRHQSSLKYTHKRSKDSKRKDEQN